MFKNKKGKNPEVTSVKEENLSEAPMQKPKKKVNWLKVSVIVDGLIILGVGIALGAMAILHQKVIPIRNSVAPVIIWIYTLNLTHPVRTWIMSTPRLVCNASNATALMGFPKKS